MKTKLYWPQCDFLNKKWVKDGVDSFWVECTLEEAEKSVFPYLYPEQIEASRRNWEPKEKDSKDIGIETDRLCYLISKDLQSIISFKWYYPYAGQWNAYCQFKKIKETEIEELEDLCNISIETL